MARPEAVAVGGYYATPGLVLEMVRTWLAPSLTTVTLCDPCAGEGEAIFSIANHLAKTCSPSVFTCEMEANRHEVIRANRKFGWKNNLHGDFFHVKWSGSCGFLWLNPPYDTDPVHKRLEERFLVRAKHLLAPGGWLAFVVPFYALTVSAKTLADNFDTFICVRFPDPVWNDFRQVILFAKRKADSPFEVSFPELEAQIRTWASDPNTIPDLEALDEPIIHIPGQSIYSWDMAGIDLQAIKESFRPWVGVAGVEPPDDINAHFKRTFPVASKPRAAHLAGAMAAGLFNGMRIVPDAVTGLPPVLIKGVFDKEFRSVEDKVNKKGEKVAELQVQHPKLSVCLLDLVAGVYHTVGHSDIPSDPGAVSVGSLSMRDLLTFYGKSLMRGMLEACPVLADDPAYPDIELPPLVRQPFPAQHTAIQTLVKLHKAKPRHGGVILGEIGSGKTTVALTTAMAMRKRRLLVMCPPHLLKGWQDEIKAIIPSAESIVLDTVTDAQRFAKSDHAGMTIGIMSRETAKLGHKWVSVHGRCPGCGYKIPARDYAAKRECCTRKLYTPDNELAEWLMRAAMVLYPYLPTHPCSQIVRNRYIRKMSHRQWEMTPAIRALFAELATLDITGFEVDLAWADPSLGLGLAKRAQDAGRSAQDILMAVADITGFERKDPSYMGYSYWDRFDRVHAYFHRGEKPPGNVVPYSTMYWHGLTNKDGVFLREGATIGSYEAVVNLMNKVMAHCSFTSTECGEPLYQAVPEPRRVPLATWIRRYAPKSYDMLVVDESHEYGSRDSAQTMAAQRLMQTDAYILHLTGSFMNGYAESVFMNMWALCPDFRSRFDRDDLTSFIDRFGYWKRIVEEKDGSGEIIEYGTQSDRVTRSARKAGVAPGILPLFNLEYLLPIAVTLQKEDLALGIPPRSDEVTKIGPTDEQVLSFAYLKSEVMAAIKESRWIPDRAGKLWGAMARLPSYFDLAATGNTDEGVYEIRWPENVPEVGGQLVASVPIVNPSEVLPKEQWMLDRVAEEISEGRNCIVFTYHTRLMPRIAAQIDAAGHNVVVLDASKVPTEKRLDWITQKVVKKNAQVLVVNPVAVQTGLNNLVHFSTEIWMENPMCNPTVFRQACGRVDRIGQTQPTRIVFPLYDGVQESAHALLMHKVGVASAVDGLDPEEALRAAGIMDSEFRAFSVGKQLYEMMLHADA